MELSEKTKSYFERLYSENDWDHLLYAGSWEKFMKVLSRFLQKGLNQNVDPLFETNTIEEQEIYLRTKFPKFKWNILIFILGNSFVFNKILYKGSFPKKNVNKSFYGYYKDVYARLFSSFLAKESFYLNLLFNGKLVSECGFIAEAQKEVFEKAKEGLKSCNVEYFKGSVIDAVKDSKEKTSFVSMSNTPSYFVSPLEQSYVQLMRNNMEEDGLIVSRHYMRVPENLDLSGFTDVSKNYKASFQKKNADV